MVQKKSFSDLQSEFCLFASTRGFDIPTPLALDGQIHRIKGKSKYSAWYSGIHFITSKGNDYIVVTFGDWVTDEKHTFKPEVTVSHNERENIKFHLEEAKRKAEESKKKEREDAIRKAVEIFKEAKPFNGGHPYVKRKKINCDFLLEYKGNIVVPCQNEDGATLGIQTIYPNGSKYFLKGSPISGTFFNLCRVNLTKTKSIYICEGLATAVSVHLATTQPVIVAFNANNLVEVAKVLRKKYRNLKAIIAGDDDHATDGNPGVTKAHEAAKVFLNSPIFPKFSQLDGKSTTDFNDLHCREGIEVVAEQLIQKAATSESYKSLGINGQYHYFYSYRSNTTFRFNSFSPDNILKLMKKDELEAYEDDEGKIDWIEVKDILINESMNAGIYAPRNVRGVGVWRDEKNIIVNTGRTLTCDSNSMALGDFDSHYTYVSSENSFSELSQTPLSVEECKPLIDAIRNFSWESHDAIPLIAGWIAIARIGGALPIRPNIALTAAAGSGKSTFFEGLLVNALGGENGFLQVQGGTTAAGIRQAMKYDSMPLIYDEFESKAQNHLQEQVIELIRQSWSQNNARTLKGTVDGSSLDFVQAFPSLVCGININIENEQDRGRFSILELVKPKRDDLKEKRLFKSLEAVTPVLGERLFRRSIENIAAIIESYKVYKHALCSLGQTSRFGDQVGMLMAGYQSLTSDRCPTEDEAKDLCRKLNFVKEGVDPSERSEYQCLEHLLTTKVRYTIEIDDKLTNVENTILAMINGPEEDQKALEGFGIKLRKDGLAIRGRHSELSKIFAGTPWKQWNSSFSRLEGSKFMSVWIQGQSTKAIVIPRNHLTEVGSLQKPKPTSTCIAIDTIVMESGIQRTINKGSPCRVVQNIWQESKLTQQEKQIFRSQLNKKEGYTLIEVEGSYFTIDKNSIHAS